MVASRNTATCCVNTPFRLEEANVFIAYRNVKQLSYYCLELLPIKSHFLSAHYSALFGTGLHYVLSKFLLTTRLLLKQASPRVSCAKRNQKIQKYVSEGVRKKSYIPCNCWLKIPKISTTEYATLS